MRRVVTAGRLRRRLAVTYAVVAAVATGALALGTYLVVSSSRLDDSVSSSLAQARTNLVLAGTVLGGSAAPHEVTELLEFYSRRPDFETVALAGGEVFSSMFSFGGAQIPTGVQRLVRAGDLAFERVRIADTPYLVAGGRPPPSQAELYFFFSEEALRDDLAQLRTILLAGWGIVVVLSGLPARSSPGGSSARSGRRARRRTRSRRVCSRLGFRSRPTTSSAPGQRRSTRWPRRSSRRSVPSRRHGRASAASPPTWRTSCARR